MQEDILSPSLLDTGRFLSSDRYLAAVDGVLAERRALLDRAIGALQQRSTVIAEAASCIVDALRGGHKVLVVGNGGSAAEAQHFACELMGRFQQERAPYAVLALTADSTILTALGNDYGYRQVFARQVAGLGQPGDLLLAFSTSGESPNVVEAALAARGRGMTVVALTGERASQLEKLADLTLRAPCALTPVAQEIHMLLTHVLCGVVEAELAAGEVV